MKRQVNFDTERRTDFVKFSEGIHEVEITKVEQDIINDKDVDKLTLVGEEGMMSSTLFFTEKAKWVYIKVAEAIAGKKVSGSKDIDVDKWVGKKLRVKIEHESYEKVTLDENGDEERETRTSAKVKEYLPLEQ